MPRILSRAEVRALHGRLADATGDPSDTSSPESVKPKQLWFGRVVNAEERQRVHEAAFAIVFKESPSGRKHNYARRDAHRAVTRFLDWLGTLPGETYQDRWLAGGTDGPDSQFGELAEGPSRRTAARQAINALIILGVLRQSLESQFRKKQVRLWRAWTLRNDSDHWDRFFAVAERERVPDRPMWAAAQHLLRICVATGTPLPNLTPDQIIDYRDFLRDTDRGTSGLVTAWHLARQAGIWPEQPETLDQLILMKPRSTTELVDRYDVQSPAVRNLLINYLNEVSVTQDYGSLVGAAQVLVGLFWKTIEDANPGIETIVLTKEQSDEWKRAIRTRPDGKPRRNWDGVYSTVRSFYLDISTWAHEDPSTWSEWAVPCPIGIKDVRGGAKRRREQQHRMQARTRTLTPHLDTLSTHAAKRYQEALELREHTLTTPPGERFVLHGRTYIRRQTPRSAKDTSYVTEEGREARVDTRWNVTICFMTWAAVEVLRHTGVRVEELLELTHLSVRQYRKADGSVLPLLQIAPSKTDAERIVPCSPDLAAVLARLVQFSSMDGRVPLCIRRDPHERTFSATMPFLFQVREAGRSRVISPGTLRKWLIKLANSLDLKDVDGTPMHFTPHDFRRVFITDIVNAGFPIHLAARLVGHSNIEVTNGYTAVYEKDLFEAYNSFITRRREMRPPDEYRTPTQAEWDEFVEHFGHRKIALGNCHRPYGSDCVHEHACVRCDFLQVDPSQAPRLGEIRDNLEQQVAEAKENMWLGDVDQLLLTIRHADQKLEQLRESLTLDAPPLAIPTIAGFAGPG